MESYRSETFKKGQHLFKRNLYLYLIKDRLNIESTWDQNILDSNHQNENVNLTTILTKSYVDTIIVCC